jgi:Fungal specific transcription factor domain
LTESLRIDAIIANYSQSTPLLTVANPFNLVSQSRHVIPLATTSFASILDSPHFSPTIIEALQDLVSFTCDVRSWRGIRPPNEEVASFTSRRAWIEWKLSTLNQNHNSQQETAKTYGLENCVKLAMLIYINIVLRKMPSTSAELLYLTEEMKTALETADFEPFWGVHIKLFTWVLFHGGAAATEAGTRKWYVKQLVEVCRVLNIWSWESVSECLSGFLWVRCTLVHRIKPLWYETVVGLSIFEVADSL